MRIRRSSGCRSCSSVDWENANPRRFPLSGWQVMTCRAAVSGSGACRRLEPVPDHRRGSLSWRRGGGRHGEGPRPSPGARPGTCGDLRDAAPVAGHGVAQAAPCLLLSLRSGASLPRVPANVICASSRSRASAGNSALHCPSGARPPHPGNGPDGGDVPSADPCTHPLMYEPSAPASAPGWRAGRCLGPHQGYTRAFDGRIRHPIRTTVAMSVSWGLVNEEPVPAVPTL
jgi:hypothetical protein